MKAQNKNMPRLVIAATESGIGKTTLVTGLLRLWANLGLRVQPFKVGPDYIDPSFHSMAAKRPSRNLDTWLLPKKKVHSLFLQRSCEVDLSIIEGVMGLYDGFSPTSEIGSSAEVAKLLHAPVILIVNGSKMARSAAALVKGYQMLDPKVNIAGVIFNFISGERHYSILKKAVEKECRIPCLGYLPPDKKLDFPEQHLGLVPVESLSPKMKSWLHYLTKIISKQIDSPQLLRIARKAPPLRLPEEGMQKRVSPKNNGNPVCRIGYAKDEAFHFYYPDNIDILERLGAKMVPFSPLKSSTLPKNLDALYFGGGFPENYLSRLGKNKRLLRNVNEVIQEGMPVYGECGGLMYLAEEIIDKEGKRQKMVGAIPGDHTCLYRIPRRLRSNGNESQLR